MSISPQSFKGRAQPQLRILSFKILISLQSSTPRKVQTWMESTDLYCAFAKQGAPVKFAVRSSSSLATKLSHQYTGDIRGLIIVTNSSKAISGIDGRT